MCSVGVRRVCGKHCKGLRGFKSHQRTCRFIAGLNDEFFEVTDDQQEEELIDTNEFLPLDVAELKPGIKLPKSDSECRESDLYVRAELHLWTM